jgi:hypothetical protein
VSRSSFVVSLLVMLGVAPLGCTGDDVYIVSTSDALQSSEESSPLCCADLKLGTDLSGADFGVGYSIKSEFAVLAQASSDHWVAANAMIGDITNACRRIARDLGADEAKQQTAEGETRLSRRAGLWCELAVAQLVLAGAGSASLDIEPPQITCKSSVNEKTKCQARCAGTTTCDAKAIPMTCTGGTMLLDCAGACTPNVEGVAFDCKGSCDVTGSGVCTSMLGVACLGNCDGTCEGTTDPRGNCQGTCKGTCLNTAPKASCKTFHGTCEGTCTANGPSAKVQCSGKCAVEPTPLACAGGKLEGGCNVGAHCGPSCDTSVAAKAVCGVMPFRIVAKAGSSANLEAAIATLRVNLPTIFAVMGRGRLIGGTGFMPVLGSITDRGQLGVKGTACALTIAGAFGTSMENAKASLDAGLTVIGQLGL